MMHTIRNVSYMIVVIGAVLMGIHGLFNYDVISEMFGYGALMTRMLYALVGLSGIVLIATGDYEECCSCRETNI